MADEGTYEKTETETTETETVETESTETATEQAEPAENVKLPPDADEVMSGSGNSGGDSGNYDDGASNSGNASNL